MVTMKPTKETKRFWLMIYAMDAFGVVVSACEYLLKNSFHIAGPIHRRTMTAILILYGQPFHNNQGIGKLDEAIIPDQYLNLHNELMQYRDKIHAHRDSAGVCTRIGNANQIRLQRLRDGFQWTICTYLPHDKADLQRIRDLCNLLITKLDSETDKYEKTCLMEIEALPEGEYLLNTDVNATGLFTRVETILPPNNSPQRSAHGKHMRRA